LVNFIYESQILCAYNALKDYFCWTIFLFICCFTTLYYFICFYLFIFRCNFYFNLHTILYFGSTKLTRFFATTIM